MSKTMNEMLDFMERLRGAFPCDKAKDDFGDYEKCHVLDVADKLNIPIEEVWDYVHTGVQAHLIDNNGGKLRFNNTLREDIAELVLLSKFAEAEHMIGGMPIGFIFKVIHNMYRNDNFCAGKLASFHSNDSMRTLDVLNALQMWIRTKEVAS